LPDNAGKILATHMEKTGSSTFEIEGTAGSNPGTATGSFVLTPPNGGTPLKVAYSAGPLSAGIQAGTLVEVKFVLAGWNSGTLTIRTTAGNIPAKAELQPADGDRTEVQGFVNGLAADQVKLNHATRAGRVGC
jgi:hypothetical protein